MNFEKMKSRNDYGMLVEVFTSFFYHKYLKKNDELAFDIGANAGMHTRFLLDILSNGKVIAFEPIPELCKKLRDIETERLDVVNAVVSSSKKEINFEINTNNFALSRIKPLLKKEDDSNQTRASGIYDTLVGSIKLDDLRLDKNLSFIKCDAEGYDFLALSTGKNVIQKYKPLIIFENGRDWHASQYGYTKLEFFQFFNDIGYVVYDIHGIPLVPENWFSQSISYEFISFPRQIDPLPILTSIKNFWTSAGSLNEIKQWHLCPIIGRDASKWL